MYCPQCREEFRPGFSECNDCGVALVASLPNLKQPSSILDFADEVKLLTTSDSDKLYAAKTLLEEAGIGYYTTGHDAVQYAHYAHGIVSHLFVNQKNADAAVEALLKAHILSDE